MKTVFYWLLLWFLAIELCMQAWIQYIGKTLPSRSCRWIGFIPMHMCTQWNLYFLPRYTVTFLRSSCIVHSMVRTFFRDGRSIRKQCIRKQKFCCSKAVHLCPICQTGNISLSTASLPLWGLLQCWRCWARTNSADCLSVLRMPACN